MGAMLAALDQAVNLLFAQPRRPLHQTLLVRFAVAQAMRPAGKGINVYKIAVRQ